MGSGNGQVGPGGILILDPVGEVFDRVRELGFGGGLWRVLEAQRIARDVRVGLAVYASYGELDWNAIARLDECGPTVVVTTMYRREDALEALRRDLVGYLEASLPRVAFERAFRSLIQRREHGFPREVVGDWMWQQRLGRSQQAARGPLTKRQNEIVTLIARGATDKEIAATLGIATATAQKHVTNILQRLQVPNRAAAVAVSGGQRSSWA